MKNYFFAALCFLSISMNAQLTHFYGFRQAYDSLLQLEYQFNDPVTSNQYLYYPMTWKDSSEVHLYTKLFLDTMPAPYATPSGFLIWTSTGEVKIFSGSFPSAVDTSSLSNRINIKLSVSTAAATYQPLGSYLTSESDPMFDTKFAAKTTTGLTEGSNLYWTNARFDTRFSLKTTDDLSEGSTNKYFTDARARAAISAGTEISIVAGVITNTAPSVAPTINLGVSHSFSSSTGFQVDATHTSSVSYSVKISSSLSLSGGQHGVILIELSANGSSGWTESSRCENGNTGTLTIGLNTTQISCFNITANVPAGYYVRLRTSNTTGTPTYTYVSGAETIYSY